MVCITVCSTVANIMFLTVRSFAYSKYKQNLHVFSRKHIHFFILFSEILSYFCTTRSCVVQYAASHTQNISKIYTFLAENTVIFSPFHENLSYFCSMRSCVLSRVLPRRFPCFCACTTACLCACATTCASYSKHLQICMCESLLLFFCVVCQYAAPEMKKKVTVFTNLWLKCDKKPQKKPLFK